MTWPLGVTAAASEKPNHVWKDWCTWEARQKPGNILEPDATQTAQCGDDKDCRGLGQVSRLGAVGVCAPRGRDRRLFGGGPTPGRACHGCRLPMNLDAGLASGHHRWLIKGFVQMATKDPFLGLSLAQETFSLQNCTELPFLGTQYVNASVLLRQGKLSWFIFSFVFSFSIPAL